MVWRLDSVSRSRFDDWTLQREHMNPELWFHIADDLLDLDSNSISRIPRCMFWFTNHEPQCRTDQGFDPMVLQQGKLHYHKSRRSLQPSQDIPLKPGNVDLKMALTGKLTDWLTIDYYTVCDAMHSLLLPLKTFTEEYKKRLSVFSPTFFPFKKSWEHHPASPTNGVLSIISESSAVLGGLKPFLEETASHI